MAAGNFTASASPQILEQLEMMFPRPTMVEAEFNHPVNTFKALAENQTFRAEERLINGRCEGVRAWFLKGNTDEASETNPSSLDCTTPDGTQLETSYKDYDNQYPITYTARIDDGKCDNEITFAYESAKALQHAMLKIRKKANEKFINLLAGNLQANQYAGVADYITAGTGNRLVADRDRFNYEMLAELALLAENNRLENYLVISGRNFWVDKYLADARRATTDKNDQARIFGNFKIYWDTRNIDAELGYPATFILNPDVLAFWNTTFSTPTPKQLDENRWAFTIQDPELMWSKNGTLVPIRYEVEYEKVCVGRTSLTEMKFTHTYFVRLLYGLDIAPAGVNGETGILGIEAVL